MTTIIPAILGHSVHEVQEKLNVVEGIVSMVQLDIADGVFTSHPLLEDPLVMNSLRASLKFDMHLMVREPEHTLDAWCADKRVSRITFHIEACKNPASMIAHIRKNKKQVCIACNPETDVAQLQPYLSSVDMVVCLGVHPGEGGQEFIPDVLEKIEELRSSGVPIGVDGGVNERTAPDMVRAGAQFLVVGNFIFNNPHISQAISWLSSL